MIETAMELAMTFWQWVVFVVLVGIGFIFSKFDGQGEDRVGFEYTEMPHMKPLPIATKDKGFFKGIWHWLMGVRQWEICDDFHFKLGGVEYVVPKGFEFDGASVPKFLAMWLSPTGVLLMGGLVHDYVYKFACLMTKAGNTTEKMTNILNECEDIMKYINQCFESQANLFKVKLPKIVYQKDKNNKVISIIVDSKGTGIKIQKNDS